MKYAPLVFVVLACALSAVADNNATVVVTPSPVMLHAGSTQQFTAGFSDGSQVQNCTWLTTGSSNGIQSTGANTAAFAAGQLKATYVVTASCTSSTGFQAMGIAIVLVY